MALAEGIYRIYNVKYDGAHYLYTFAGRFKIQNNVVAPLDDPEDFLVRNLEPGPLDPAKERFINSILRGSYRHVIIEQPGVAYLPVYEEVA